MIGAGVTVVETRVGFVAAHVAGLQGASHNEFGWTRACRGVQSFCPCEFVEWWQAEGCLRMARHKAFPHPQANQDQGAWTSESATICTTLLERPAASVTVQIFKRVCMRLRCQGVPRKSTHK